MLFSLFRLIGRPIFYLFLLATDLIIIVYQQYNRFKHYFRQSIIIGSKVLIKLTENNTAVKSTHIYRPYPIIIFIVFIISIGVISSYLIIFKNLPSPQTLVSRQQEITTKIYDRHGLLLYQIYKDKNRSIVSLNQIPDYMIQATIAIEDATFYTHPGFSLKGILRALTKNAQTNKVQGGSTITQQLVKNTLLTPEKTLIRKIKELILSLQVEYYFTKDEILTMYFNEVGYGGTAYGIEAASQQYFNKSVSDINLAEAALLAGLPQSPTIYSPYGASPELAVIRQHQVLTRMVEEKMITGQQAETAKTTPLTFASPKIDISAPHFVMYVKDQLVKEYGETLVESGGLEVITTLDSQIQTIAETAVTKELNRLANMQVKNGAVLVTNPKNGEILAMVGSKNYFDTQNDGQVNVTLRPRQPGSSIKPLTYALALSNHQLTPGTLIDDSPIVYKLPGSPPYSPQNYDGRYHGKITARMALANSYNIPAVKILSQIGVTNLVAFGQEMGITTWNNPSRFGLSLTLGGGEVKMTDMATAYAVFANNGVLNPLVSIVSITDYNHKPYSINRCLTNQCTATQVLDQGVAFIISDILSDNQARSIAFGANSVLNIPNHQVAVKTGTTNDLRDNWTIGYTPNYLVATWVGNNDNSSMSQVVSGITGASPIWRQIITTLLVDSPQISFYPPDNVVKVSTCTITQTLFCDECPNPRLEYYLKDTQPKSACTLEQIAKIIVPSPSPSSLPTPSVTRPRNRILDGIRHLR